MWSARRGQFNGFAHSDAGPRARAVWPAELGEVNAAQAETPDFAAQSINADALGIASARVCRAAPANYFRLEIISPPGVVSIVAERKAPRPDAA